VIIKAFNPTRGNETEHHLNGAPEPPNDKLPHVYTLIITKGDRWGGGAGGGACYWADGGNQGRGTRGGE
jgi:hypothetical protein